MEILNKLTNLKSTYLRMFLRKLKSFNKSRYSRNRQYYRTGVYMCLWLNIILVFGLYYMFYRFSFNFNYVYIIWSFFVFFVFFVFFLRSASTGSIPRYISVAVAASIGALELSTFFVERILLTAALLRKAYLDFLTINSIRAVAVVW